MRISLEWMAEYLEGPLDARAAAEALTHGGLNVELIETLPETGDTVIDVEVTSNRGDCLSYMGIARELSALLKRPLKSVVADAPQAAEQATAVTSVTIDAPDLCPYYTARIVRNVRVGPTPDWMVRRLAAMGQRSVNNVADITNYVMFETGQPLHAFDFDAIRGRRIIVRKARAGEKMYSIDGHERILEPHMLVIADAERPVALAGVMGGLESEVSGKTTKVLIESARFDPLCVRRTARGLGMKSESSYRFERAIDPAMVDFASRRCAQLMLQIAGGELLSGMASAGRVNTAGRALSLRLSKLRRVLGIDLSAETVVDALGRLHLSPALRDGAVHVTVPSYRADLNLEEDLAEEVARLIGYERIPVRDEIHIRLTPPEPEARTLDDIRTVLVGAGYFEAITVTFVSDILKDDFVPADGSLPRADPMTRKADAHLRPSLLPGLLESVRHNETAGTAGAKLFEIGSTFRCDKSGAIDERRRLALVGSDDLHEVRGTVEALLSRLDADRAIRVVPEQRRGFAPGVCGRIEWGGQAVGHVGRTDSRVLSKLSLRGRPAAAELDLLPLLKYAQHVPQLHPLPRYPAVRRDVSLIVAEAVTYRQIETLLGGLGLANLEQVEYVTTYRGRPLEKGTKSVTFQLVFRSAEGTLTSQQVDGAVRRAIDAAGKHLGATVRA